jgi:hypothetical protein
MIGDAWMHKRKAVELRRSRVTPAAAQDVWAVVSRPDLALTLDQAGLVIPVPYDQRFSLLVLPWNGQNYVRVMERVAVDQPHTIMTIDRTAGGTTRLAVRESRGGGRMDLQLTGEAERPIARQMLDAYEQSAGPWLETLAAIAEGRRPFPAPRPDAVLLAAGVVGPASASIPASAVVTGTAQECWDLVTPSNQSVPGRFWVTPGPPAAGHWMGTIQGGERLAGLVTEVVEYEEPSRLTVRSLAGDNHPSLTSWQFAPAPGGTHVTFNHRCATSHVGLTWSAEDTVARMAQALADR